jgi:hypothetical protein
VVLEGSAASRRTAVGSVSVGRKTILSPLLGRERPVKEYQKILKEYSFCVTLTLCEGPEGYC